MDVSFHTKFLRDLCERPSFARRELGKVAAQKLYSRLADIESAESLEELVELSLLDKREGELIVHVTDECAAVFQECQNGSGSNGGAKVSSVVRRIKLVGIKNGKSH